MRPVANTINIAMFDRIEVDIIHMLLEIVIITNLMFPETALPDC